MKTKMYGKSILLLLSVVLISGCVNSTVSDTSPTATGSIVFNLTRGEVQSLSVLSDPLEPTHIRVRISHENGYRVIRDIKVPQSDSVEILVPAIPGYRVDAVSYIENWNRYDFTDYHLLLKHATETGINVAANNTTMVELVLQKFEPHIIPPNEVITNESFEMMISNIPDFMYPYARVKLQTMPFTDNFGSITEGADFRLQSKSGLLLSGTNSLNSPDSDVEGNMYIQSTLWLDETMVKDGEHRFHFRHWYPNIDLGESQMSVPLKLPEGGIGIGIVY